MADGTHIEWTDATWQIVTGCSVVSPGCTNCYAMKLAGTRLRNHPSRAGLTVPSKAGPVWNGVVRFNVGWLTQPLQWTKPRRIFVAAHGDLFHEAVQRWMLVRTFAVMALTPRHTYQVLTKRAERMCEFINWLATKEGQWDMARAIEELGVNRFYNWPLPNVWLGVSTEDQARADERIPHLLATPAAVRWISAEPLLGEIDLCHVGGDDYLNALSSSTGPNLDWIVAGGESGPGARPCHPDWIRGLRDQCQAAGVAFFFKQWGAWLPGENDMVARPCLPAKWQDGETGQHSSCRDKHGNEKPDDSTPEWRHFTSPGEPGAFALRVGKKAAGNLLDGVEHQAWPR